MHHLLLRAKRLTHSLLYPQHLPTGVSTCPQIILIAWGEVRGLKLAGGFFPLPLSPHQSLICPFLMQTLP